MNRETYAASCGDQWVVLVPPSSDPTELVVTLRRRGWRRLLDFALERPEPFVIRRELIDRLEGRAA
jgi:hypothetical protein